MKLVGFNFLTRGEVLNQSQWKKYFDEGENLSEKFSVRIWPDAGFNPPPSGFLSDKYVNHNTPKDKFKTVAVRYNAIESCDSHFIIFLSEDTLPLKPISSLIKFLEENIDKSIFSYGIDNHSGINDGRVLFSKRDFDGFPDEKRLKNCDWVCLCEKHYQIIKDSYHLVLPFERGHIGSEHFVSSILNLHGEIENVINSQLVYEDWSGVDGKYPTTFTDRNIDLIKKISENPETFFLRKFRGYEYYY
jgi:hypothetical protein